MYIVVQTSPSEEIDLPKSAHDEYGKGYICIAESTVHDLHGPCFQLYKYNLSRIHHELKARCMTYTDRL